MEPSQEKKPLIPEFKVSKRMEVLLYVCMICGLLGAVFLWLGYQQRRAAAPKQAPVIELVGIAVGDSALVSAQRSFRVDNPEPVKFEWAEGEIQTQNPGETCSGRPGDQVTVVGIEGEHLLIRYERHPAGDRWGTTGYCNPGVVTLMTTKAFVEMAQGPKTEQLRQDLIQRLLEQSRRPPASAPAPGPGEPI